MEPKILQRFIVCGFVVTILRLLYTFTIITSKQQETLSFKTYYMIPKVSNTTVYENEPFLKNYTPVVKEYGSLDYSTILFVEAAITFLFYIMLYTFFNRFIDITKQHNNLYFQFAMYSISAPMFYVCTLMLCGMIDGVCIVTLGLLMSTLQFNGAVMYIRDSINTSVVNGSLLVSGFLLFVCLMIPLCIQFVLATSENNVPAFVYFLFFLLLIFYVSFGVVMVLARIYKYDIFKLSAIYIILDVTSKVAISACLIQIYI